LIPYLNWQKLQKMMIQTQAKNYLEQLNQIDLDKAAELKEIFNK